MNPIPPIKIDVERLAPFGQEWLQNGGALGRTPPLSSSDLGRVFDSAVAASLAAMLGGIPVVSPGANDLIPSQADCVELGPVRVVGGVRPQNFDVGYRPDGVRFVFDSKTLNDAKSVGKNWQNMVNDLATEATTVHTRFPHAIVAFLVIIPGPCLGGPTRSAMIGTLERLSRRAALDGPAHMAEAISLLLWEPGTGEIVAHVPEPSSLLRIERFSEQIEMAYSGRYKGLPPHAG
ncbi:MAG: hypothetical protein KIS63_09875 [Caldilineales bacterium]|nr:hypothetical protein [Caldilineales bacterium]